MRRFFYSFITVVSLNAAANAATPPVSHDQAGELAKVDCRMEFTNSVTRVELCTSSDKRALVRVSWKQKKSGPPTIIKALFSADSEKLWQRLTVPSGDPVIQKEAQKKLRHDLFKFGPKRLDPRTHAVLDFVVNFAQPGTSLKGFDPNFTDQLAALQSLGWWYNLICDSFGKTREATFNIKDIEFRKIYTVGDTTNSCPGRCGMGCGQVYEWRVGQYTQECLNHDACTDLNGAILGECQWLFVQAALGYLLAPDCNYKPSSLAMTKLEN